jgi:hypothetical protein
VDARLKLLFLLLWGSVAFSAWGFDHDHSRWDALLKKHVLLLDGGKASRFDYTAMAQDRPALKEYLATLSAVDEGEFKAWTREQQMAFLINAYNAFTVEKILMRYPNLRSIWDFGRIFSNPFRDSFFKLLGAPASLDTIEHDILRKRYADRRIHYAVNCASIGCPMLREEAYAAPRLEAQLEAQARRFLSDRSRNRARDGRLEVSRIFEWFGEDFEPLAGYFAPYAEVLADDPAQRQLVAEGRSRISFLEYDWSLNDSRSSSPR